MLISNRFKMPPFIFLLFLLLIRCESDKTENNFEIIPRDSWNALEISSSDEMYRYSDSLEDVLFRIIIHHSAFPDQPGPKFLQEYQMLRMGYNDIAYHYIIGKGGVIFEGRPLEYMGAHAGETKEANELAKKIRMGLVERNIEDAKRLDPDYGSIGICLDGNFDEDEPDEEQLQSLARLIKHLQEKYSIKENQIFLHSEVDEKITRKSGLTPVGGKTICPGKSGAVKIKTILQHSGDMIIK